MKIKNSDELKNYIVNISSYYKGNKNKWNLDNNSFIEYILENVINKDLTITKIDILLKSLITKKIGKKSSDISLDYYKAIGYENLDEIKLIISEKQKARSKRHINYWLAKGFSESDSVLKVKEYQSNSGKIAWEDPIKMKTNSPVYKEYWVSKGLSEIDAIKKVNPNSTDYYGYNTIDDYNKHILKVSANIKNNWLNGAYDNKHIKYQYFSKEEKIFFNLVKDEIDIICEPFGINVIKSNIENKYFYSDAYIKINDKIILLEYDGTYWHNIEKDEIRDTIIFETRQDIIGIIRIKDSTYKSYKNDFKKIIQKLKHGIKEIESGKRTTIKF